MEKCPYCGIEMASGKITGYGRRGKIIWESDSEKIDLFDKIFTEKGRIQAKYTFTKFEIGGDYCPRCNKIIIDAKPEDF